MDIPKYVIWINILLDEAFKYSNGAIFWGYVGANAKPVSVEFCHFVQFHILVNYLSSCWSVHLHVSLNNI
jgi:hypothetical protein